MSDGAPGEVQPWLLLGERRRRSLEDRVGAAAKRWAAHWVAGTVTLSIAFEPAARDLSLAFNEGHKRSGAADERGASDLTLEYGDGRTISFGARGKSGEWLADLVAPRRLVAWAAGLGAVEFSATADLDEGSLAGELELEVLRGFWGMLVPQAVAVDAPLERLDEPEAEGARRALAKRGLGAACVFGSAPGFHIQWTLSPTIVAMLLAERRVSYVGESLISRRSALAQAPVAVDCCLGSIQVPVRDLHSLRLGDVLMTDIALDGHAQLRVRSKPRPIAAGTLGQVEGRKAIKVETAQVVTANQGLRR